MSNGTGPYWHVILPAERTNQISNPSVEFGTSGWSGAGAAQIRRVSGAGAFGAYGVGVNVYVPGTAYTGGPLPPPPPPSPPTGGLIVWLKPETLPAGGNITQWDDSSASGTNDALSPGASPVAVVSNIVGTFSAVNFTGAQLLRTNAAAISGTAYSVFVASASKLPGQSGTDTAVAAVGTSNDYLFLSVDANQASRNGAQLRSNSFPGTVWSGTPPTTGLTGWYRADAINAAGVNGSAIGTWENSVTTLPTRRLTQNTTANMPTYRTNVVGTLPVVRFDGVNDILTSQVGAFENDLSIYAVLRTAATAGSRTSVAVSVGSIQEFFALSITASGTTTARNGLQLDYVDYGNIAGAVLNHSLGGAWSNNGTAFLAPWNLNGSIAFVTKTTAGTFAANAVFVDNGKWRNAAADDNGTVYFGLNNAPRGLWVASNRTSGTFGTISSAPTSMFAGMVRSSANGSIYNLPFNGSTYLRVNPVAKTLNTVRIDTIIGATYRTMTSKWVEAATNSNGMILGCPHDADVVLRIDTDASGVDTVSVFGNVGLDTGKFGGIAFGGNGKAYCVPYLGTVCLEIDPDTNTITPFGTFLGGVIKYNGAFTGPNGKVYGVPRGAYGLLEIDPWTRTAAALGTSDGDWVGGLTDGTPVDGFGYGSSFSGTGYLYMLPLNRSTVRRYIAYGGFTLPSNPVRVNELHIVRAVHSNGTATVYRGAFGSAQYSPAGQVFSAAQLQVGGHNINTTTIGNYFTGDIGEILVYEGAAATTDEFRGSVEGYLAAKWGGSTLGWRGMTPVGNDSIFAIPYNSNTLAQINPLTGTATMVGVFPGTAAFSSAVAVGSDLYLIPFDSEQIVKYDTRTRRSVAFGTYPGSGKWLGAVAGADGTIYALPYNATSILRISRNVFYDPFLLESYHGTFGTFAGVGGGSAMYSDAVQYDGTVYGIPFNSSSVLALTLGDKTTNTLVAGGYGGSKWSGGAIGDDGRIYAVPWNNTKILTIDPVAKAALTDVDSGLYAAFLSGTAKFSAAVRGDRGRIYGIPYEGTMLLEINTTTLPRTMALYGGYRGGSQWYGGATDTYGRLYGAAHGTRDFIRWTAYGGFPSPSGDVATSKVTINRAVVRRGTATIYRNGASPDDYTTSSDAVTAGLTVGALPALNTRFFTGYVLEALVYQGELSDGTREAVESYLAGRYTPTISALDGLQTDFDGQYVLSPGSYTASVYARADSGSLRLRLFGSVNGTAFALPGSAIISGTSWQRAAVPFGLSAVSTIGVLLTPTGSLTGGFYADGFQLESGTTATTYIDGDQLDGTWLGRAHASRSFRPAETRLGGEVVRLDSIGFRVETSPGIGAWPFVTINQAYALHDGAAFQRQRPEVRQFELTAVLDGTSWAGLHAQRRRFIEAVRTQNTPNQMPAQLLYSGGGGTVRSDALWTGGMEFADAEGFAEPVSAAFTAPDPYWHDMTQEGTSLAPLRIVRATGTLVGLMYRDRNGVWGAVGGTTAGLWPQEAGTSSINVAALLESPDSGTIWIGQETPSGSSAFGWLRYVTPTIPGTILNPGSVVGYNGAGVNVMAYSLDGGTLYVGGSISSVKGTTAAGIVTKGSADAWGTSGIQVFSITTSPGRINVIAPWENGSIYVGGQFGSVNGGGLGTGGRNLIVWSGTLGDWSALSTQGSLVAILPGAVIAASAVNAATRLNNAIIFGGQFDAVAGTAGYALARYTPSSGLWGTIPTSIVQGTNAGTVFSLYTAGQDVYVGMNGTSSAGTGLGRLQYTQLRQVGSLSAAFSGTRSEIRAITADPETLLWAGGLLTTPSSGGIVEDLIRSDGVNVFPADVYTGGTINALLLSSSGTLYAGGRINDHTGGTAAAVGTIVNSGMAEAYPTLRLRNHNDGTTPVVQFANITTNSYVWFNLVMLAGEEASLNLNPGEIKFQSSLRGDITDTILPGSKPATWRLMPGTNLVSFFALGTGVQADLYWTPRHHSADGGAE